VPDLALVDRVLAEAWRRDSRLHGEGHWYAVTATGLDLAAAENETDSEIVFLFGLLHDTRRENEGSDRGHGRRAAGFARELHVAGVFTLEAKRLDVLCHALERHAYGEISDDPTVGVCWDADRLHLARIGVTVDPALLSTASAREPAALAVAAARRSDPVEWPTLIERLLRLEGLQEDQSKS
jgi:uncharacterized protein